MQQGGQTPGGRLWISGSKMGEQVAVRQVPAAARVIGHHVDRTGKVVVPRKVPAVSLVQCIVLQEVGAGAQRGRRAFVGPGDRRTIVAGNPTCALADVVSVRENILVGNHAG